MVAIPWRGGGTPGALSVLALSSRFDGLVIVTDEDAAIFLSVLALSSRFDGRGIAARQNVRVILSVLALSSRFDGRY